jgi:hypothetical protein
MATSNSVCIRCGKERIVLKSWKEFIGTSQVTYTTNICPDPKCQKVVDANLKDKKDYLENIHAKALQRRAENKRNRKTFKKAS